MSDQGPAPIKRGIDLTFNFTNAIAVGVILVGLIGFYYKTGYRQDATDKKIEALDRKADQILTKIDGTLLIDAAVTAQRIKDIERRLAIAEHR